jgi:hypothetical protein
VQTPSLNGLIHGPLSAVRGAVDTVRYASAFVTHAASDSAGLRADDDERALILDEEFSAPFDSGSIEPGP